MERRYTISAAQFFGMMFVSRVTITIALNAQYAAGESLLDGILSYGLAMVVGFLLALPLWGLCRDYPEATVGELAGRFWGNVGKLVPLCYIAYFVLLNASSLALFELFLLDTVNPDFSAALVVAAIVGVAVYGAWRGIETLARCAACVLVLLLVGSILVFALVAQRFRTENLEPLFQGGVSQLIRGTGLFLSRTSIFADMAVLLPFVRGRKVLGFSGWAGGTFLFVGTLILLIAGCLGQYAYTQNFPVYALASITEVRSMQRLDPIFIGIWMMGLIIKVGCDLYACRVCIFSFRGKKAPAFWIPLLGAAIFLLGAVTASFLRLQAVLMDTFLWLGLTFLTGFLLPLGLWISGRICRRKEEKS